jgi:hypothetical protein
MMTSPKAPKLGLDARAAELKEKLLKSRARNQNRDNSAPPAPLTTDPAKESTSTPSSSNGPAPSTPFLPQDASKKASAPSIQADASDIAALIASLSSPADIPDRGIDAPNKEEQDAPGLAKVAATPQTGPVKESGDEVKTPAELPPKDQNSQIDKPIQKAGIESSTLPLSKSLSPKKTLLKTEVAQTPSGAKNREDHQTSKNDSSESASQTGHGSVTGLVSPDSTLTSLLGRYPDLRDWLELTDYYNVEVRTRRLDRFRKVKALAAQKLKIEEEERRLMEEEALEMGLQRPTITRLPSSVPTRAGSCDLIENGLESHGPPQNGSRLGPESTISRPPQPSATSPLTNPVKEKPATAPVKRAHDENNDESRQAKTPRLAVGPSPVERADSKSLKDDRRESRPDPRLTPRSVRISPPRRSHSPLSRPRDRYRSPPYRPRDQSPQRQSRAGVYRDNDDFDDRPRRYDSFRGDGAHSTYPPRRRDSVLPAHINLGRNGGK